jgi:phosphate transport system substrate-binding protein
MLTTRGWRGSVWAALAVLTLASCSGMSSGSPPAPSQPADVALAGAGATLPEPFYTKAFYEYSRLHANVSIVYQPVGSGMGIARFTDGSVDFGASDVPLTPDELDRAGGLSRVVQIPGTLSAIALAYKIQGVYALNLDGDTLARIFMGQISRWNDPVLAQLNPGVNLPDLAIVPVHRSDGSGTTYHFTSYLSLASPAWKSSVGSGKTVNWPLGLAGNGNDAVGSLVRATAGSIGYVELAYAMQGGLSIAAVRNNAGRYVTASVEGAQAAAVAAPHLTPQDFSILDEPGDASYPISAFSWLLLRRTGPDGAKLKSTDDLFKWLVGPGQQFARNLGYAPLPAPAKNYAESQLDLIKAS